MKSSIRTLATGMLAAVALTASLVVPVTTAAPAHADPVVELFAAPSGSGQTCSVTAPCSLTGARDLARTLSPTQTSNIEVNLRGGTYQLAGTFELTAQDSGTNGHRVIYQAYPGEDPVLSGGQEIGGWSVYDAGAGIYRAQVGTGLDTRQLFVDGVRADRARGAAKPTGFTRTATGYTAPDTAMASWGNPGDIEIVGFTAWRSFRCPVASIAGTAITMQNPCWNNARLAGVPAMDAIEWVENAYELLDAEGEWYLDRTGGYVYYKPRAGQDLSTATVVAPVLETLVSGTGTLAAPIQNITLRGLHFAYGTWLQASTDDGYVPLQAGFSYTGTRSSPDQVLTKPRGNVSFEAAKSIVVERSTFTQLGGVGIAFDGGSQQNTILGNRFEDVSATSILIGNVVAASINPSDARAKNTHNTISNNYIADVSKEYIDMPGIIGGYTSFTTISHNELTNLPYSGISQGWGWGTNSYAENNRITDNYIHDVMRVLGDGGGIYTLSAQPDSEISGNHLQNMWGSYGGWGIYPDEGSAYFDIHHNVVKQTGRWISMWTPTIHDNLVRNNYSDTTNMANACTNCTLTDNTVVTDGAWPAEAQGIMANAGLEPAYWDLAPATTALDGAWPAFDGSGVSAKEWTAPARGYVKLTGGVGNGGAPLAASVLHESVALWGPETVATAGTATYDLYAKVLKGDRIRFTAQDEGGSDVAALDWTPVVKFDAVAAVCEFVAFELPGQLRSTITLDTREVVVSVPDTLDVTSIVPTMTVSEDCHSVPGATAPQDFSAPVAYELRDVDGTVSKNWTVRVVTESTAVFERGFNVRQEIGDTGNWVAGAGTALDATATRVSLSNGFVGYMGRSFKNELIELEMLSASAGGVEWPAIGIRQPLADKPVWDAANAGYILVFKPEEIELQRFNAGVRTVFYGNVDGQLGSEGTMPNHVFDMGTKHLVQFGAVEVDGGVRLVASVDGKKVFDYTDTSAGRLTKAGHLAAYGLSAPVTVSSAPAIRDLGTELADLAAWHVDPGTTKTAFGDGIQVNGGYASYTAEALGNELLEFDMQSGSAGGMEWPAIALRQKESDKALWDPANEGYVLVFKPTEIELQRFNAGVRTVFYGNVDGQLGSEGTLANHVFPMDEKHRVQFGAINTTEGVRLIVRVDGRPVIDYIDTSAARITTAGHLGIYAYSAPVTVTPRPADPTPVSPGPRPGENLALGQVATALFTDGSRATMHPSFESAKAVDGDPTTFALASGQHKWIEQVDLGSLQRIDRVVVTMPPTLYATEFDIAVAGADGAFTVVKHVTGFGSGTSDSTFSATDARFVRIIAVKPDGPNQTGIEMAISELEVYNAADAGTGGPGTGNGNGPGSGTGNSGSGNGAGPEDGSGSGSGAGTSGGAFAALPAQLAETGGALLGSGLLLAGLASVAIGGALMSRRRREAIAAAVDEQDAR